MKEREFQRQVIRLARERGWRVCHFGNTVKWVRRGEGYAVIPDPDGKGFPDLVLVRDGRLLFRELKGSSGRIGPEQAVWVADLREAGCDAGFWYPEDPWEEQLR